VTFIPRPPGTTIRRAQRAIFDPHPGNERFDPDFPVTYRCELCGKVGWGPRKHLPEALRIHRESDCSARSTKQDEPGSFRLTYPRI